MNIGKSIQVQLSILLDINPEVELLDPMVTPIFNLFRNYSHFLQ